MNGIVVAGMLAGTCADFYRHYLVLMSLPHTGMALRGNQVQERRVDRLDTSHLPRSFINRVVKWELKYIPRGDKGSLQNVLRFSYNILRRKHMTQRKSRHDTLKELVERMQRVHPDFTPVYDKEIFKI